MARLRSQYLQYMPKSEGKIDEIFVSVLVDNKNQPWFSKIVENSLNYLKWNESFLEAIAMSDILESDNVQLLTLKERIFRHFWRKPLTENEVFAFFQVIEKSINSSSALEFWDLYSDLKSNSKFADLIASKIVDGITQFIHENIREFEDVVSRCNDSAKLYIFEMLLENHQSVLERNPVLMSSLMEVTDFSKFSLSTFDQLIYSRQSKQDLGRRLLTRFQKKDPLLLQKKIKDAEGLFLTGDGLDQFRKRYAEFLLGSKTLPISFEKISNKSISCEIFLLN